MFRWEQFLKDHDIPFVERGPNINRNQIGIKCPLCGAADPSEHLVLPREALWWSCRRNKRHGGERPTYLIQLLIGCTSEAAESLIGTPMPNRAPDEAFGDQIRRLIGGSATEAGKNRQPLPVKFPEEFRPLRDSGMGRRFVDYMQDRLYTRGQVDDLRRLYGLQYATSGRYAYRVIVPVWTPDGLMSWTGRTISKREEIRYKSHSGEDYWPNEPPPIANIHDLLLNEHNLGRGGDALVVGEGPLDGMRLDYFGDNVVRGTCFFGKSISARQIVKLLNLAPKFKRKWVLLDADAKLDALDVWRSLESGGFKIKTMDEGKDPGGLPEPAMERLIGELTSA